MLFYSEMKLTGYFQLHTDMLENEPVGKLSLILITIIMFIRMPISFVATNAK